MDLDATIVSITIQDTKSWARAIELGIISSDLTGPAVAAWDFMRDHLKDHGAMPAASLVVEQSGCPVRPVEAGIELSYVVEKIRERALFYTLREGLGRAAKTLEDGTPADAAGEVVDLAEEVKARRVLDLRVHSLAETAPEVLEMYERTKRGEIGIPYPWPTMTAMTQGLWPGTLTFFVARPSVGKSWTVVHIALNAWQKGHRVLLVSPEMNRVEISERLVARVGFLNYSNMVSGQLGDYAEERLRASVIDLQEHAQELFILDDEERLSPEYIEQATDMVKPDLVCVDSIYMMRAAEQMAKKKGKTGRSSGGGQDTRYDRILLVIDWLRSFAKRKNVPVVAISQLNKEGVSSQKKSRGIREGSTMGLENTLAMSDTLLWDVQNLFAMHQDDDMRADKQMLYIPLKTRRRAFSKFIRTRWDMDSMNFDEIEVKEHAYADTEEPVF